MKDVFLHKLENTIGSHHLVVSSDPPVYCPSDESVLRDIIRFVRGRKLSLHITGMGTYPLPESGEGSIRVSTKSLTAVQELSPDDSLMIVQSGIRVQNAADIAEKANLYIPLDITSGRKSTVAGAFMTGATGPSTAGYGAFRGSVIGIRCITAQGDYVTFGGRTAKNATGYNVTRFLAGTLGLYALASEVIIKLKPFPESRLIAAGKFIPQSKSLKALSSIMENFHDIKQCELTAIEGLGNDITIGIGFEGMDSIVFKNVNLARDVMEKNGSDDAGVVKYEKFMSRRRKASKKLVGPGLYTVSVPLPSSVIFLKRLKTISSSMPVFGHPKLGRFHFVCHEPSLMNTINDMALAVGGKLPVVWGQVARNGVAGLFTQPELALARSLKHQMDPDGIFNPQLGLV